MKELLIDTYFRLTDEHIAEYGEKTVVIMQVGAFYEVYGKSHKLINGYFGSKIQEYSDLCDLKIAPKSKVSVEAFIYEAKPGKYSVYNKNLDTIQVDNIKKVNCSIVMAGFRDSVIEKYIEKMNNTGYTIVIYNQDETDVTNPRILSHIITPGTYFKEDKTELTNNIMTCYIHHQKPSIFSPTNKLYFGVACIDILTGNTNISEHSEKFYKSCQSFNEVEKLCNVYKPNEFIILYYESDITSNVVNAVNNLASKHTISIRKVDLSDDKHPLSKRALNCCKQNYQHEIIKQYYSSTHNNYMEINDNIKDYPFMMNAFVFLLDFINKQNSDLIQKIQYPKFNSEKEILLTENYSLSQLNIINDNRDKSKYSSLSKFLNKCVTNMGKRKMNSIISSPITDETILENEYNKIEYMVNNIDFFNELRSTLSCIHDLETFFRKLSLKKISPYDISILYDDLEVIHKIYKNLLKYKELEKYQSFNSKQILSSYKEINKCITNVINVSVCRNISNTDGIYINFFKKGIYQDIDDIEMKYIETNDILETIQSYFTDIIKTTEKKSKIGEYCKIHETDKSGKMLKLTDTRAKKLTDELTKYKNEHGNNIELKFKSSYSKLEKTFEFNITDIKKEKRGNDTIINSKQINQITNDIEIYKNKLRILLREKLTIFISQLFEYTISFKELIDYCIELDISTNKTYIAYKYNYCKPIIESKNTNKSFVSIKKMRHPLIEHINKDEIYVPHDISLGCKDDNKNGILLFGTNAVGKSSLMKALGMCVIMAQCGFFVPCSEYIYKPFTRIFTRILSNDNIFKGLSTFAVEMSELRNIIDNSDENSLVIGDELCSGTELGSAISIFVATLISLHNKDTKFIFATHFHEITKMKDVINLDKLSMKHLSVYYDNKLDQLVYDRVLKDGPGNNKYGLEVCKAMNLNHNFIDLAMDIRNNYISDIDKPVSISKPSHFNKDVIIGICEMCGVNKSTEVHHLQHQKYADKNNKLIDYIHKNKKANLASICNECHNKIHKDDKQHIKKKTNKGYIIVENKMI